MPATLLIALFILAAAPPTSAQAQMSQAELRRYAEAAIQQQLVKEVEPSITPNRDQGVLFYYLGSAHFPSKISGDGERIPLMEAVDEQLRVGIIRKYRNTQVQRNFWNPVLTQVEGVIAGMLADISAETDTERLRDRLAERRQSIQKIYQAAMDRYARGQGLNEAIPGAAEPAGFIVNLATNPPGGKIYLMVAGDFDLYEFRRKRGEAVSQPIWEAVEQTNEVVLDGAYWFKVEWNGVERYKKFVRIRNSDPIVFPAGN